MKYSIDEFAQFIRDDYGEDLSDYDNLQLVQDYFDNNPEHPQLKYLDYEPDLLFPTAVEEEIKQREQELVAPQQTEQAPEQTFASQSYLQAQEQYEQLGSDAAPGFFKQLFHNLESHAVQVPGAVYGMVGWGANKLGLDDDSSMVDTSESLRQWGKDFMQEKIEDDLELQALQIWQQDEPVSFGLGDQPANFYEWDMLNRGMASALPSMIEMAGTSLATKGIAALGYVAKGYKAGKTALQAYKLAKNAGKLQTASKIGGVGAGVVMEGSETYNTAMEYGLEQGMTAEEANNMAGVATMIAAPIKGGLEYLGFSRMASSMGLDKVGKRELNRIITGRVFENALARGGAGALKNSLTEGMTEWGQFMTDAMVQKGYKEGFGDNMEDWFSNARQVVLDEGWSPEARESIYGGMLMGKATGFIGDATKGFGTKTPERYAKQMKMIDEAYEEAIKGKDKDEIAFLNNVKATGYHKNMQAAVQGLDEDGIKLFFDKAHKIYEPKGFDEQGRDADSVVETDTKIDEKETIADASQEVVEDMTLDSYAKGILLAENRKPIGDTSKFSKEDKKIFDKLEKVENMPFQFRALAFVSEGKTRALKVIDSMSVDEKNAFIIATIKGIKESGGLSTNFDIEKTNPLQRELIVRSFAKEGKYNPTETSEVGGEQVEAGATFDSILDPQELERVYAGQDTTDETIVKKLTKENIQNIEDITKTDQDLEKALADSPYAVGNQQVEDSSEQQNEETKAVSEVDLSTLTKEQGGLTPEQIAEAEKLAAEKAAETTTEETKEEIPIVNDENLEVAPEVETSKTGVKKIKGEPKKGIEQLKEEVNQVLNDSEGVTWKSGHKSVWFGDSDYSYKGASHKAKKMPALIQKLQSKVEKTLGKPEGYYNSVLMNTLPAGVGIKPHTDAEGVFLDEKGEIGSVGVLSFGGTTIIDIIDKKSGRVVEQIEVADGDIYEMPAGKFQNAYLHGVGASDKDRVSLTFRKVASPKTSTKEEKISDEDAKKQAQELLFGDASKVKLGKETPKEDPKVEVKKETDQEKLDKQLSDPEFGFASDSEVEVKGPVVSSDSLPDGTTPSTTQSADLQATTHPGAVPVIRDKGNTKITLENGQEIQFNNDQQSGFNKLKDWAFKLKGHFGLTGYAGTGKSTLLNTVLAEIKKARPSAKIGTLAPTHKAKNVLKDMGVEGVDTIASAMGFKKQEDGSFAPKYDKNNKIKVPAKTEALRGGFLVIDEASMIDDSTLKSMLEILQELDIRAILVGDPKQLPPVGQNHSSAFKQSYFDKLGIDYGMHELTMVERQAQDNPLFNIFTELRQRIGALVSSQGIAFTMDGLTGQGNWFFNMNSRNEGLAATSIENAFVQKALEYFTSADYKANPNTTVITSATKKRTAFFNDVIRKGILGAEKALAQFNEGEVFSPNKSTGFNDDLENSVPFEVISKTLTTKSVHGETINGYDTLVRDGVNPDGTNKGERTIFIVANEGKRQRKKTIDYKTQKVVEDKDTNLYWINSNESYLKVRKMLEQKVREAPFSFKEDAMKELDAFMDTYIYQGLVEYQGQTRGGQQFIAHKEADIDFAYAINIHKVQGSTYENVFYDEMGTGNFFYAAMQDSNLRKYNNENFGGREVTEHDRRVVWNVRDRMAYTAVTRPTKRLFVFRPSRVGSIQGKPLTQKPLEDNAPIPFEYQSNSNVPLISKEPQLFDDIVERLQKHFPEVTLESLDRIMATDGREVLGQAMGMLAQWSKSKATLDTVPHEYAHIYLNMYANQPIVKQGLSKFGNEELAEYIGLYYQDRLGGSLKKRVGMWLKQFWLKIKKLVGAKFTDQDVKDYLAGSFFSGKRLGKASKYENGQWDWNTDNEINEPEYQDVPELDKGFNPADRATLSFFSNEMKVRISKADYGLMNELARNSDTYESFYEQFKDYMQSNYDTKAFEFRGMQKKKFERMLKQLWHKSASKVPRWDGEKGLLYLEAIKNSNSDEKHILPAGQRHMDKSETQDEKTLSGGKNLPDYYASSFTDRDGVKTIYMRMGDMVKEVDVTQWKPDSNIFWLPDDFVLFTAADSDTNWSIGDFGRHGYVYTGSKGGDHSALAFTTVPDQYKGIDEQGFQEYMQKEIADKNITKELGMDMAISLIKNKIPLDHAIARHEWWKSVKYPEYLIGTHLGSVAEKGMGVQDHYDRLKIDMNDGWKVRGLGSSSIMTVNAEDTYFEYPDGTKIPYTDHDGTLWSSGKWFKKLSQSLGEENLTSIKGMVRSRIDTGINKVDYIGIKSIQLRPYNGMKLVAEDGSLIAEYVGRSTEGTWVDKDGREFDHLSSTDTSKMTNGRFSNFNTIQPLDPGYQSIILNPSEEKNGAYPVTQGELAMDIQLLSTPVGRKFYDALQKHYKTVGDSYIDDLFNFIKEPSRLAKELTKYVDENDIMPELQKFVEIVGDEGLGLMHPAIYPLWKDSITNKFIKNGLFKMRPREKYKGGNYFYKPFYAPAMGSTFGELREGDFVISAESKSMVKLVQQKYQEATGEVLQEPRNIFEGHSTYWKKLNSWLTETDDSGNYINNVPVLLSRQPVAKLTGVVMRNVRGLAMGGHGKTMMLSKDDVGKVFDGDWDGDKGIIQVIDDQEVIDAYMNFQQSPQFKKLDRAVNLDYFGKRLRNTSLANEDQVVDTINNINAGMKQIGMMTNGRNTMFSMHLKGMEIKFPRNEHGIFKPTDEVVMEYVNMRLPEDPTKLEEMYQEIYERNGDSITFRNKSKGELTDVNSLVELRDAMLDPSNVFHLKTTKQNEMAIVLQMAVDDSKYGLLGSFRKDFHLEDTEVQPNKMPFGNDFVTGLMFKDYYTPSQGKKYQQEYLIQVKKMFNFSKFRQGYDDNQQQMKLEELMGISKRLQSYNRDNANELLHNHILEKVLMKNRIALDNSGNPIIENPSDKKKFNQIMEALGGEWKVDNPQIVFDFSQTTPQEDLMMRLGDEFDSLKTPHEDISYQKNNPLQYNPKDMSWAADRVRFTISKRVKDKLESTFEGEETLKDRKTGVAFAEAFSQEFYGLFEDREKLSIDFSEEIEDLLDKWIPKWNDLTPRQQTMSTIKMLQGTTDSFKGKAEQRQANRMKFFPLDVVHHETLKLFLRDFHNMLNSPELKDFSMPQFREFQSMQNKEGYQLSMNVSNLTTEITEMKCG
tara:strand:+ start:27527 stop:36970 length:9444 start_codon:yes stop_codon:yes gene_type:complete